MKITVRDKIRWFFMDVFDFLAKIEMTIKYLINKKRYDNLGTNSIPKETDYCYSGCVFNSVSCPYMDYSKINNLHYCHYKKRFDFPLLDDFCKICGVNEAPESEEEWKN